MNYYTIPVVTSKQLAELYQCSPRTPYDHLFQNFEQFLGYFFVLTGEEPEKFKAQYPHETNDSYEVLMLWTIEGMYLHSQLIADTCTLAAYCRFVYHHFEQSKELQLAIDTIANAFHPVTDNHKKELNK